MKADESIWMKRYYNALVGCQVVSVDVVPEDDFGLTHYWPRITLRSLNGELFTVEVSRDSEGNGPGFLFGLPEPS